MIPQTSVPPHAPSESAPQTLRFGVMCTGTVFPLWQASCIRKLVALPAVAPALLIVDEAPDDGVPRVPGLWRRLRYPNLLWNLYNRAFTRGRLASNAPVDLAAELANVPAIKCRVERRGPHSQYFRPADLDAIRAHRLDFILRFAFNIIRGDIHAVARYGVWSYHHDDIDIHRGMPACFWPVYFGEGHTGVTLQRLNDRLDGGVVLARASFATIRKSYPRNRDAAFLGAVGLPARVCRDLQVGRAPYVDGPPSPTTAPVRRAPTNVQVLRFIARSARNRIADAWQWLARHEQWGVGIVESPIHAFLDPAFRPRIRWLPAPPSDRFFADPFGLRRDARTTILVEYLDQSQARPCGIIAAIDAQGRPGHSSPVLRQPVHLSYPFLLEHEGEVYCIPEMAEAREVVLFRADPFPTHWVREATLIQGVAALDPTVVCHEGRWWLFADVKGLCAEHRLYLWHAPDLKGPWTPHASNPLKIDARCTRPAGTPFTHNGALYRPAQDCSSTYGGAVIINRVTALSPDEFAEEPAVTIRPDPNGPYPAGLHTISAIGDQTVIDGKRHVFIPALCRAQAIAMLRKLVRRPRPSLAGPSVPVAPEPAARS